MGLPREPANRRSPARRALAASWLALAIAPAGASAEPSLPPGFEDRTIATGLTAPTAVAWAPDGRAFVAEKAGRVRVIEADGTLRPQPLIDISDHVNSYWDRGLLGIAVAPDFAQSGRLYLLYTYETDPTRQVGRKVSRLTRVTVNSGGTLAYPGSPETIVLGSVGRAPCKYHSNTDDCIPSDAREHSIGTVRADPDGTLWVGSGDATQANTANPGSFRAYDTASMAGKLLHVDASGRGLPGHPFCPGDTNLNHVCTKIHARGLRNPYRFTLRPGQPPIVGDVGWFSREELDLAVGGGNFGWPCREGTIRTPIFDRGTQCAQVYAQGGHDPPLLDYRSTDGAAVVAGPLYSGQAYPADFRGELFFGDYVQGFVRRLELSGNVPGAVTGFAEKLYGAVDLEPGPGGDLTYVSFGTGQAGTGSLHRIAYSPDNATPLARVHAQPTSGPIPLQVGFDGSASEDPDGNDLAYDWDFGDGSPHSADAETQHTYQSGGARVARLTVTDSDGAASAASVTVFPGNRAPEATILEPTAGATFAAGRQVALRAVATDPDQGELRGAALYWYVGLRHGTHLHQVGTFFGESAGFMAPDDHDADSHYEITLVATDAAGAGAQRTVEIHPRTIALTLASNPPGASLGYAGRTLAAPETFPAAVGFRTSVSAPLSVERDGFTWRFARWSDAGARVHDLIVPAQDTTMTVAFGRCLYRSLAIGRQRIGPLQLGERRGGIVTVAGRPLAAGPGWLVHCVRGGGRTAVGLSTAGRAEAILTTAPSHTYGDIGRGASVDELLARHPDLGLIGPGLYATGPDRATVFAVKRDRVDFIAIVSRRLLAAPGELAATLDGLLAQARSAGG